MKRKTLQVRLQASVPSVVDLTVGETVQLDRIVHSRAGVVPRRHGDLLAAGTTRLALEPGTYGFKTLSEASLRVVQGAITTGTQLGTKNSDPDPSPRTLPTDPPPQLPDAPGGLGDELPGVAPSFTVE
jgi:hypothetical protein